MYAAAGGASIASRKARQNKAQGKIAAAAKKAAPKGVKPVPKVQPQSKQFHHLPENYHKSESGCLVPPNTGLPHSHSMNLRPGDSDSSGMRPCRSAHELPGEDGTEKPSQSTLPVGSPPRAYSCTHWESKLQKTPPERIVGFGSADVPFAVCEGQNQNIYDSLSFLDVQCAQGKAAWQDAAGAVGALGGRRCSVVAGGDSRSRQSDAHLRWMKRNRIHDLSYGGSSSDEEDSVRGRGAGATGGVLYVGLGTVALGLVISFVGTGDKGFKTYELRLAGPALIAIGLACCIIRILLCLCPNTCRPARARQRPKEPAQERLLLTERPPPPPKRLSIAATALLLKHERETQQTPAPSQVQQSHSQPRPITQQPQITSPQTNSSNSESQRTPHSLPPKQATSVIPLVMLSQPPPKKEDSLIELQTMDGSSFDISSISSSELSVDNLTVIENSTLEIAEPEPLEKICKLVRTREPVLARRSSGLGPPRTVTFADTPNIIAPPSEAPPQPTEIVLTPSKLGQ